MQRFLDVPANDDRVRRSPDIGIATRAIRRDLWETRSVAPHICSLITEFAGSRIDFGPREPTASAVPMAFSMMISIGIDKGSVLTRFERNCDAEGKVKRIVIYSHGFPDASVCPTGGKDGGDAPFASRLPRKWCEKLLRTFPNTAFVCFNSRGIPGSDGDAKGRDMFAEKTLTGDLDDLHAVLVECRRRYSSRAIMILCGLSTGAMLSVAYLADSRAKATRPAGAFVLACVSDFPSSSACDFSQSQLMSFKTRGYCLKSVAFSGMHGGPAQQKSQRRLNATYLASYKALPGPADLAQRVKSFPLLLIHGDADRHVPYAHAEALYKSLSNAGAARVDLVKIRRGNHFLSSSSALRKANAAMVRFVKGL